MNNVYELNDREHVEHLILDGICDECDHDMSDCYNKGFCKYESEENEDGKKL